MTTLWINDIKIDLGKARIQETKQINSFLELQDRQTSFTNKFVIPETPINTYAMEMYGAVGDTSDIPYQINSASIYRRGIPTIENGRAIIQKRTYGRGYDVNINYGNNTLFDDIGSNTISNLDLTPLNHNFLSNTITDSFSHTWQDGFMYTLANYGYLNDTQNGLPIIGNYQVPSLFRKYLWDLIFTTYGYTYSYVGSNNIFESQEFETSLITVEEPILRSILSEVNFNTMFTSLNQKSFFKSVVQDLGLMFQRKQGSNNYEFITLEDFITNTDNCIDFSEKYHRVISVDASLKGYAKQNYLRYQYDNEEDDFADSSFELFNETLADEKQLFVSPFKAPKIRSVKVNDNSLFSLNFFEPSFNDDGSVKEVKVEKSKPYIHTYKKISGNVTYVYDNLQQSVNTLGTPYMSFDGLTYSEIISKNYSNFILNLQNNRTIIVELSLNAIDVLNFDFFNKVYIKQLGGEFYMNKISGFEPGKLTKCELIPIKIITGFGEYSDEFSDAFNT